MADDSITPRGGGDVTVGEDNTVLIMNLPALSTLNTNDYIVVDNGIRTARISLPNLVTFVYNRLTNAEDSEF